MFFTVQGDGQTRHAELLDHMFRLRKRVFSDQLGWDVEVCCDREKDRYDVLKPVYLLWANSERSKLYASIRLMPTTGPTLLYDVFRKTFPDEAQLSAPGIWEGTRACVDADAIAKDYPEINASRAFSMVVLAASECAFAHGIHTIVSNYEPQVQRIYRRAGAEFAEHGRADGFGRFPVCCGTLDISANSIKKVQGKLGISFPLYKLFKARLPYTTERVKAAA